MKVVYLKDIPKTAKKGDIKEVADGYGRFLLSSGVAVLATGDVLNKVQQEKKHKEGLKQKSAEEFKALADALKDKVFVIEAKVSKGVHLFGAIHEEDVKQVIQKETGISVNPKSIKITKAIKEIGTYTVTIAEGTMHTELQLEVKQK